jgi:hypothetical protein
MVQPCLQPKIHQILPRNQGPQQSLPVDINPASADQNFQILLSKRNPFCMTAAMKLAHVASNQNTK